MDEFVPFGGGIYLCFLGALVFSRGMDFLSTWLATPNLVLEANPIAKRLGWRLGIPLNIVLCLLVAAWPLPALVISTSSMLVASRNFQSAWIMRSMGEHQYRCWMAERLAQSGFALFISTLLAQTLLHSIVGGALLFFAGSNLITLGIGAGIVTYALAVLLFTLFSLWRSRRPPG